MSGLAVIVAPADDHLRGVRDTLVDWAAAGLVQPFCWVSADRVSGDGTVALQVEADGMSAAWLQVHLSQAAVDEFSLCVLVPAAEGAVAVSETVEQMLWHQISSSRNNVRVIPMRVVVARPGAQGTLSAQADRPGWHNFVVSPEQSSDPTVGVSPLPPSDDPVDIGRHAAVVVAGLCGLWTGANGSPIGKEAPSNGRFARLARAHMVWADGTSLEHEIEKKALNLTVLPRPTTTMGATAYIDDWQQAMDTAAQQLLTAHVGELKSAREQPPAVQVTGLGIMAALTKLWGFLWNSIKNAPTSWARAMLTRARSEIADRVHQHVFGANSSYRVIAGLRTATPLEISRMASDLSGKLDVVAQNVLEPTSTFPGLWSDFVGGALTMMDAGQRGPNVTPVRVGTDAAVVRSAAVIAPRPDVSFTIDGRVPGVHGSYQLSPVDFVGLEAVRATIDSARAQDPTNPYIGEASQRLQDFWMAHAGTYTARVGSYLGGFLGGLITEVQQLAASLEEASVGNDEEVLRTQKKLGNWMRILAILLVVGLAIIIGLAVGPWLTLVPALLIGSGWVLSWLVATVITFLRGQRALFAALNRREEAAGRAQVNFRNLRYAVRDLRRTSDAYSQFLAWSQIISLFVHQPLGSPVEAPEPVGTDLVGLPDSLSVGQLRQPPLEQDGVASQVRRGFFGIGWSGRPWAEVFGEAAHRIGPGGSDLLAHPERLFSERPGVPESLIDAWTTALQQGGLGTAPGRPARDYVRNQLLSDADDRYLQGARVEDASGRDVPLATFVGGIANQQLRGQRFDGRLLKAAASTDATASGVASVMVQTLPVLGRAVARVELSPPIPAEYFRLDSGRSAAPAPIRADHDDVDLM